MTDRVVLINRLPTSGKTPLGRLAAELGWVVLSKGVAALASRVVAAVTA